MNQGRHHFMSSHVIDLKGAPRFIYDRLIDEGGEFICEYHEGVARDGSEDGWRFITRHDAKVVDGVLYSELFIFTKEDA